MAGVLRSLVRGVKKVGEASHKLVLGLQPVATFAGQGLDLQWSTPEAFHQLISSEARQWCNNVESMKLTID